MASKTKGPVLVAGSSYYLPAMSNTGLFKGYVIDPGSSGYADVGRDNIHSVLITHGHLDHTGRLPLLARRGHRPPVFATPATLERNCKDDAARVPFAYWGYWVQLLAPIRCCRQAETCRSKAIDTQERPTKPSA